MTRNESRLLPGRGRRGMNIGGFAALLVILLVAIFVFRTLRQPPEAKYMVKRTEFATPAGTVKAFAEAREKYKNFRDPHEDILACMTKDDITWFLDNKRFISASGQFGQAALISAESEQRFLAMGVLLQNAPRSTEIQTAKEFVSGAKAVVVCKDGGPSNSVRLVREGENWKILHWFQRRWCDMSEDWIYNRLVMEGKGAKMTPFEARWIKAAGKEEYAEEVRAFYAEVGAPPPFSPASKSCGDSAGRAKEFVAAYAKAVEDFLAGRGSADTVLAAFTSEDRAWFERYWKEIAQLAPAAPGAPAAAATREAALKAVARWGPISSQCKISSVAAAGVEKALVKVADPRPQGPQDVIVCLVLEREAWRITTVFFSRDAYWTPKILAAKRARGEPLATDELDYSQHGNARFQEAVRAFYQAVGEPVPGK